ncbi:RES domain-containing protein [Oceanidesulfovibrio indonesiensis]|uniref:RES domain-containing protein n=2 Tax=Oceanidesulfovibrio indonesiensis TaxID=54767 RepID=A0A7M3MD47_9BACT|nr:RES domain-containing protein [Oceanidesulfovibrio indonesiensis]
MCVACSNCFQDQGLKLDARQIGTQDRSNCPRCGVKDGFKLNNDDLIALAHRFFVWGSLLRVDYGAAPLIQFNEHQKTSIKVSHWLSDDIKIFEEILDIGFFHYGPRLWMLGEIEPLKMLQNIETRASTIEELFALYPSKSLSHSNLFYRIRVAPDDPTNIAQFDSPPNEFSGHGRFCSKNLPILYASPDLQVCIHECRVKADDEVFVATMRPEKELKLFDLSVAPEENVSEFDSFDIAMHMLFMAGEYSYEITKDIAKFAMSNGYDGIIYPSYFTNLRMGLMPLPTAYGVSVRLFPEFKQHNSDLTIPNLAIFGRPVLQKKLKIDCINKLIISKAEYSFHFGPIEN